MKTDIDRKIIFNCMIILSIEIVIVLLAYINLLLVIVPLVLVSGIILFYYTFIESTFFWICMMIVGTALDESGQIIGGLTVFHIAYACGLLVFILNVLYTHKIEVIFNTPINKYIFIYIGFTSFSLMYTPNFESAISFICITFALFVFYLLIINSINNSYHYKILVTIALLMNLIITIVIFNQLFNFDPRFIINATENTKGEKILRASGTFHDPNVAATFLMFGIIMSLSLILYGKIKLKEKIVYIVLSIISFMGMLATFSRTGWISLFIGIIVLLFFNKNRKKLFIYFLFMIIVVIIGLIFTSYGDFIFIRITSIFDFLGDPSIRSRIFMGLSGLEMYLDNPIFGIGYRGFPKLYNFYIHPMAPPTLLYVNESHTLIVTLISELGLFGVGIVFFWFKKVIKDNLLFISNENDYLEKAILIGTFANFISLNINFFFYGSLFPHYNLLWLIFALVYKKRNIVIK